MEVRYQGREQSNDGTPRMTIVHKGTREECDAYYASRYPKHSTDESGVYTLDTMTMKQVDGPYWEVTETYYSRYVNGQLMGEGEGPTKSQLQIRMTTAPLSEHPDYLAIWDHYLAVREDVETAPTWVNTAKTAVIDDPEERKKYRWCKNLDSVATIPAVENESGEKKRFVVLFQPEIGTGGYYFQPQYEIMEESLHATPEKANWASTQFAGRVDSPQLTDFGIIGGNFLNMGGGITAYGNKWKAQITYRHNPRKWNKKLYGE